MRPNTTNFQSLDPANTLNWVHFGDLHLTTEECRNHQDFNALIDAANAHLSGSGGVNFAFLPGDNADNGNDAQYTILVRALEKLDLPYLTGQLREAAGQGVYQRPQPKTLDVGNRIGAYPEKGIPGTLLGPNLLGHP